MHEYDKSSKWLIQHHGDSLLRLAGIGRLSSWRPLQAEVVQPRQLPDGLLEARLEGRGKDDLFLLEIATYPEARAHEQLLRDLTMVHLARRRLPEVVMIILCRRGKVKVESSWEVSSPLRLTSLRTSWRIVELWKVPAAELMASGDVGLIPLVPLTAFDIPPDRLLRQCREQIDRRASSREHANLLAVTQVMTRLRFPDEGLLTILGGSRAMIESPLIQEIEAKSNHQVVLKFLEARFGPVPDPLRSDLAKVLDRDAILKLAEFAAVCTDLEAFRTRLRQASKPVKKKRHDSGRD
jgi:predicted transposase YdaD